MRQGPQRHGSHPTSSGRSSDISEHQAFTLLVRESPNLPCHRGNNSHSSVARKAARDMSLRWGGAAAAAWAAPEVPACTGALTHLALPRRGAFWVLPTLCRRDPRCRTVFAIRLLLSFESVRVPRGLRWGGTCADLLCGNVAGDEEAAGMRVGRLPWSPKNYEAVGRGRRPWAGETFRKCGQDIPIGAGSCRPLESPARMPACW